MSTSFSIGPTNGGSLADVQLYQATITPSELPAAAAAPAPAYTFEGAFTCNNVFATCPAAESVSSWDGMRPDKDWALHMKFKIPSNDYGKALAFNNVQHGAFNDVWYSDTSWPGPPRYLGFTWTADTNNMIEVYASQDNAKSYSSRPYVEFLVSYSKDSTASTRPDVNTGDPDAPGLSMYYRNSADGAAYGTWYQFRGSVTRDTATTSNSFTWPDTTPMQMQIGASWNGGDPMHGDGQVTYVALWNARRTPGDVSEASAVAAHPYT